MPITDADTLALLNATLEQSAVGITWLGEDGRWFRVNRKFCDMLGYRESELAGAAWEQYTHPEDIAAARENIRKLQSNEITHYAREKRYLRRDGTPLWVRITRSHHIPGAGPGKGYYVCIVEDISAERAARQALRQRDEALALTFERAPLGIAHVGMDFRFLRVNPKFAEMLGCSPEDLVGLSPLALLHPDDREAALEGARQLREHPEVPRRAERRLQRRDGTWVWVAISNSVVCDAEGQPDYLIAVIENIDASRRAADALVREVHHRIKNHLQGVIGLLMEHLAQHPELEGIIKRVMGQIYSIAVVHGLQSRLGDGEVVLCELIEQIVRDCVELERLGAPPEVPRLAPGVKLAKDHAVSIALVLNELILNACKHRLVRADESPFTVDIARGVGFVEVVVRNRVDARSPVPQIASGTGLGTGLSIAKALMPRSGGTLSIARKAEWFEARLVLAPPAIVQ